MISHNISFNSISVNKFKLNPNSILRYIPKDTFKIIKAFY